MLSKFEKYLKYKEGGGDMLSGICSMIRKYSPFKKIVQINVPISGSNRLEGKTGLIFGGSGGIGAGIAQSIVNAGGSVILLGTNEATLKQICGSLNRSEYRIVDVSNIKEMLTTLREIYESHTQNIDLMVYAVGIHGGSDFMRISENEYDSVMDVNIKAMFFATQSVAEYMIDRNIKGHILTIGSASGVKPAWCPYEISKWAVRGFTLGLARELVSNGIVVNSIAPGPVKTKMLGREESDELNWVANPTGRLCTTEEIGELAVFMLSDTGSYIIGDTVFMSGGSGNINIDK